MGNWAYKHFAFGHHTRYVMLCYR